MSYFKAQDDCNIYYEVRNFKASGPVLVFLNGTAQTTLNWKFHSDNLKDRFRVVLYDARAQGQSDLGQVRLSPECHAADLAGLLGHLGVETAHLVGLSHGAYVALTFACRYPRRVSRLVLCSVSAKPDARARVIIRSWRSILRTGGIEAMAWAFLPFVFGENFLKQNEKMLDNIVKAIVRRNREKSLDAHLEAITGYPPLSHLARDIRTPALVISGCDDPLVKRESAEKLAKLCRGRHQRIVGAGHSVPAETPQLFSKTVAEWVSRGRAEALTPNPL